MKEVLLLAVYEGTGAGRGGRGLRPAPMEVEEVGVRVNTTTPEGPTPIVVKGHRELVWHFAPSFGHPALCGYLPAEGWMWAWTPEHPDEKPAGACITCRGVRLRQVGEAGLHDES